MICVVWDDISSAQIIKIKKIKEFCKENNILLWNIISTKNILYIFYLKINFDKFNMYFYK